jgi:hypothetical protein
MHSTKILRSALIASVAILGFGSSLLRAESIFDKGTQGLTLAGGYAFPIGNDHESYTTVGATYSYYLWDNIAIAPQLEGHYADSTNGPDTFGGEFSIKTRWHFYQKDRFTLFVDGGLGLTYWDSNLPPPDGTQFNFAVQAGTGFTQEIRENLHLVVGLEWIHFSNGHIQGPSRHYGSNAISTYVGLMWLF